MRHRSSTQNLLTMTIAFVIIAMSLWIPDLVQQIELVIVAAAIALVGIPHGAIDHLIAAKVYEQGSSIWDHIRFYGWYLFLMVALSVLWFFSPAAGFILFMVISVLHFGQSDIEGFFHRFEIYEPSTGWVIAATVSRGLAIIGLILSAHADVALSIVGEALPQDSILFQWMNSQHELIFWGSLGQFALFMPVFSFIGFQSWSQRGQFLLDSVVLIALFVTARPLLSFAIYFAFWHSMGHIDEIRTYFGEKGQPLTIAGFAYRALPFTLISFAGLAGLLWIAQAMELGNRLVMLTFVLISVLTLPHMVVAHSLIQNVGQKKTH